MTWLDLLERIHADVLRKSGGRQEPQLDTRFFDGGVRATELPLEALGLALVMRQPERGLVHHSDRGCQYASELDRAELSARGIVCSMSRVGNCWDNAVAESLFATLKMELIHRRPWPTKAEARSAVHDYIGVFFNPHRRHSPLGYVCPMDFERLHAAAAVAA